jgi:tetratricopeptide (TPR) repeat protein
MKTCFVISPLGQEDSDIRKNADDLYQYIIKPALEIFDFYLDRGDKGTSTASITEEVIKKIQDAELCIVDLTWQNANVFYECGRRHETAKPFILIKKKGEPIPFDLRDIRTVDYDMSDFRSVNASIETLRKFVRDFEDRGYGSESSKASLSSIAETLTRLERKIDLMGANTSVANVQDNIGGKLGAPADVFYEAIDSGNTTNALKALKKFMRISSDINLQLDMASELVENYEPAGVPIVREILEKNFDSLEASRLAIALFGLCNYYIGAFTIKDEYQYLSEMTKKSLQKENITAIEKADLYNVLANIEFSVKNNVQAAKYQEKTIELEPNQPAFYYNAAAIYQLLGQNDKLIDCLNWIVSIYKTRDVSKEKIKLGHLEYARKIFADKKMNDKLNEIDTILANAQKFPENLVQGV